MMSAQKSWGRCIRTRGIEESRETLEKMERDKVRRAQMEIKRLKKMSRQLGIELDLKE